MILFSVEKKHRIIVSLLHPPDNDLWMNYKVTCTPKSAVKP
jgi:hypothetical protein